LVVAQLQGVTTPLCLSCANRVKSTETRVLSSFVGQSWRQPRGKAPKV